MGEGSSADDALRLVRDMAPDVACLDISMPGGGLAAAGMLKEFRPELRIAMLAASEDHADVTKALTSGADGYVLKGVGAGELISVVRALARGEGYISPTLAGRLLAAQPTPVSAETDLFSDLTHREKVILDRVLRGMTNKEIARDLDLQGTTVKHYMTVILQKLHVRNRTEAALLANARETLRHRAGV